MTKEEKEYTEIEKEAIDWISKTDAMQFSQLDLLTMFAYHCKVLEQPKTSEEDNIKQVVKDVKYLISTDCCDETIQARIEGYSVSKTSEDSTEVECEKYKIIGEQCAECFYNAVNETPNK